jgi:hypothetical protein
MAPCVGETLGRYGYRTSGTPPNTLNPTFHYFSASYVTRVDGALGFAQGLGPGPAAILVGNWHGDVFLMQSGKKPVALCSISGGLTCLAATDELVVLGSVDGDLRFLRMDTLLSEGWPDEDLERAVEYADWSRAREAQRKYLPCSFLGVTSLDEEL